MCFKGCTKGKNSKYQIPNIKKIPMTKIQKSKLSLFPEGFGHAQRRRLRRVLNIGICDFRHISLRKINASLT
jgi:hypothetical protein